MTIPIKPAIASLERIRLVQQSAVVLPARTRGTQMEYTQMPCKNGRFQELDPFPPEKVKLHNCQ